MDRILKELQEIKGLLRLQKKMLTLDEFCTYTGISKAYAYHLTSNKKVKFYRPLNKLIFFDIDDIVEFIKQNPSDDVKGIQSKVNKHFISK